MSLSIVTALVPLIFPVVLFYQEYFGKSTVVVATSPAEAMLKINGQEAGKTPLTLELKRRTYTFEASKPGYEPAQHATFVSRKEPNLVNIQLVPVANQQKPLPQLTSPAVQSTATENTRLVADIEKLKAAVLSNPEDALSLPLLREKLMVQEELSKAIREELKEVKEQNKWYLGSMITIVVGLLAVIATLFVGLRGKTNA